MKTFFKILLICNLGLLSFSCRKDIPPLQKYAWITVKAVNYQVSIPGSNYREIVFDFKISSDSLQKDLLNLPQPMLVVLKYKDVNYPFELPANESTIRLGNGFIVNDTITPTQYRIVNATYPDPSYKINY
jgi:hypothetical protein